MANEVSVSVIIPVYNGEQYLKECLDSLRRQTLKDIEFVCVNDGSTDGTLALLEEYAQKDERFIVVDKENTGYGHSMNVGVDASHGQFISGVDSDDFVAPNAFELMLGMVNEYSLDFTKADRLFFSGEAPDESSKYDVMGKNPDEYEVVFNPSENPSKWMMAVGLPGLYRKSFLEECDIRHNETPGASFQDTGFTAQALFNARRVKLLREPVYMVRRDNENSSSLSKEKVYCLCEEHDFIREAAKRCRGNVDACTKTAAAMRLRGYLWNFDRIDVKYREAFVLRAQKDFIALKDAGELDSDCFSENEWRLVNLLIEMPMEFYAVRTYERELQKQKRIARNRKKEIDKLKSSRWYKLSRFTKRLSS